MSKSEYNVMIISCLIVCHGLRACGALTIHVILYSFIGVMWDLWWTKWRGGRFSQSTSVSPANLYSTNFSIITITYHQGLVQ
jgi:hypothetical protein